MTFSRVVDRARADFMEMPGLELTVPQAVRLWGVGADDGRHAIDVLVEAGVLTWTARRTVVRTGRAWTVAPEAFYVSVRRPTRRDRSVERD